MRTLSFVAALTIVAFVMGCHSAKVATAPQPPDPTMCFAQPHSEIVILAKQKAIGFADMPFTVDVDRNYEQDWLPKSKVTFRSGFCPNNWRAEYIHVGRCDNADVYVFQLTGSDGIQRSVPYLYTGGEATVLNDKEWTITIRKKADKVS